MTTYNWTIATCEYEVATGGITVAHWRVDAVDENYSASAYGAAGFTPDPSSADFVPYESLTETDILVWVWGLVDKTATEASLKAQIEAQKNPVTMSGLPW